MSLYSSKIELLFDLKTNKPDDEGDPLYSFIKFFEKDISADTLWKKWIEIEQYYLTLKTWFRDVDYYHKVGFLVCAGVPLSEILEFSLHNKKSKVVDFIDSLISKIVSVDIASLDYKRNYEKVRLVLLLFNVETIRSYQREFFPFHLYKGEADTIEHIHAQNSEGISKTNSKEWRTWLLAHENVLRDEVLLQNERSIVAKNLLEAIPQTLVNITFLKFQILSDKIISHFSKSSDSIDDYMHSISNLALLGNSQNIQLSNAVFNAKRLNIIEMDKEGLFIPVCTKRVFLKYYNNKDGIDLNFWSKEDREQYILEIEKVLLPYLKKTPIIHNEN